MVSSAFTEFPFHVPSNGQQITLITSSLSKNEESKFAEFSPIISLKGPLPSSCICHTNTKFSKSPSTSKKPSSSGDATKLLIVELETGKKTAVNVGAVLLIVISLLSISIPFSSPSFGITETVVLLSLSKYVPSKMFAFGAPGIPIPSFFHTYV